MTGKPIKRQLTEHKANGSQLWRLVMKKKKFQKWVCPVWSTGCSQNIVFSPLCNLLLLAVSNSYRLVVGAYIVLRACTALTTMHAKELQRIVNNFSRAPCTLSVEPYKQFAFLLRG